jgi:uncharacterized protein (TIGR03083 family)
VQTPELQGFRAECAAVDQTLAAVEPEDWTRPALGSWNLAELVAHLIRQVTRLTAYADQPVDETAPVLDRHSYLRGAEALAPDVAARAVSEARKVDAETLPALFAEGWRGDADLAASLPADRLITTVLGPIRVDDYLATRLLEVVVHHLDVRAALDLPPAPTADGGRLASELLEGMLGSPRPRLGRVRFLLTATGRLPSDDGRFPLIR